MIKNIAITAGGNTQEYETSIKSGRNIYESLSQSDRYTAHFVAFENEKDWFLMEDGRKYPIDKNDFSVSERNLRFDAVLNMIHGGLGEDGSLAGYLDLIGMPYTSSGKIASTLTFCKRECLSILHKIGIPVTASYHISKRVPYNVQTIAQEIGFPCIVKANTSGSSLGVFYTSSTEELSKHIEKAFAFDSELTVEKFLDGVEVSIGAYRYHSEVHLLKPTEIVPPGLFFDYEAKYSGKTQEITPARIDPKDHDALARDTKKIFQYLNLKGFARFDFIIQDHTPFLLEINTVPGMTAQSIILQQLRERNIPLKHFLEMMLDETLNSQPK